MVMERPSHDIIKKEIGFSAGYTVRSYLNYCCLIKRCSKRLQKHYKNNCNTKKNLACRINTSYSNPPVYRGFHMENYVKSTEMMRSENPITEKVAQRPCNINTLLISLLAKLFRHFVYSSRRHSIRYVQYFFLLYVAFNDFLQIYLADTI